MRLGQTLPKKAPLFEPPISQGNPPFQNLPPFLAASPAKGAPPFQDTQQPAASLPGLGDAQLQLPGRLLGALDGGGRLEIFANRSFGTTGICVSLGLRGGKPYLAPPMSLQELQEKQRWY